MPIDLIFKYGLLCGKNHLKNNWVGKDMTAAVWVDALGTQMSVDPIWGKEGERSLIFQRFIPENYIKLLNCGAGVTFIDASSNRQFVWAKSILNVDPSPSFAAASVTQSCPPVNYTSLIGWYWLNISLQTASKIEETENSVSLDCFCNCGQLSLPSNLWI